MDDPMTAAATNALSRARLAPLVALVAAASLAGVVACTRSGSSVLDGVCISSGDDWQPAAPQLALRAKPASDEACSFGGTQVAVGLIAPGGDGASLESPAATLDVCLPDLGAVRARIDEEGPSDRCPDGATRLRAGSDRDGNGTLSDAEVEAQSEAFCHPAPPPALPVLSRVDGAFPSLSSCEFGGHVVRAGYDADGDGRLADSEASAHVERCESLPKGTVYVSAASQLVALAAARKFVGNLVISSSALDNVDLEFDEFAGSLWISNCSRLQSFKLRLTKRSGAIRNVVITSNPSLQTLVLPWSRANVGPGDVSISGMLQIQNNPALRAIRDGLDAVREVGDSVTILDNPALLTLSLPSLRRIGGGLLVQGNTALVDLWQEPVAGYPQSLQVETVGDSVTISKNAALRRVDFPNLRTAGSFMVEGNARLVEYRADALVFVREYFDVYGNPSLTLPARPQPDALRVVGSGFGISNNPALVALDRFSKLETVIGNVFITQNASLQSTRFTSLRRVGDLHIEGNEALASVGEPDGSLQRLTWAGGLSITDNPQLTRLLLPALVGPISSLDIYENASLPHCRATELVRQLGMLSDPAHAQVHDNDETGYCE